MSQPDLEHSPAMVLRSILTTGSGAYFSDASTPPLRPYPLFISTLPDEPDVAAALYDTEGVKIARLLASGNELQKFGIQLLVRTRDYQAGFHLTQSVANLVSRIKNQDVVLNSITYTVQSIMRTSPVLSIGQDPKRRDQFSLNLLMFLGGF